MVPSEKPFRIPVSTKGFLFGEHMGEIIPFTAEHETSKERFAWDEIIRAIETLSEYDSELDVYETLQDLKDEELEDAYMLIFNYAVNVVTPNGQSNDLEYVMDLLQDNGMMEGWQG